MIWVNQIVQGILLGGYYAVLAAGLSLMFGVMRIINLAHGDLAVLGAFLVFVLCKHGLSPWAAIAIVLPAMAVVGWALQRTILERALRGGELTPLLATFGLLIVIENLLFEKFGADERSLFPYIGKLGYDSWTITNEVIVAKLYVLILVVAILLLGGLQLFLARAPARSRAPRHRRGPGHRRARRVSTPGGCTPSLRRSRLRPPLLPAPSSGCGRRSTRTRAHSSSSSRSRPSSSAASARSGERSPEASSSASRRTSARS